MVSKDELMRRGGIEWLKVRTRVDRSVYVEVDSEEQFRDLFEAQIANKIAGKLAGSEVLRINQVQGGDLMQDAVDVYEAEVMIVKNPGWLLRFFSAISVALKNLQAKGGRKVLAAKEFLEDAIRQ
jgi:hypothetical protein